MGYFHGQLGLEREEKGLIGEVSVCMCSCVRYELISFRQGYACFCQYFPELHYLCQCGHAVHKCDQQID